MTATADRMDRITADRQDSGDRNGEQDGQDDGDGNGGEERIGRQFRPGFVASAAVGQDHAEPGSVGP